MYGSNQHCMCSIMAQLLAATSAHGGGSGGNQRNQRNNGNVVNKHGVISEIWQQ